MNLTKQMLADIHNRVQEKLGFKVDDETVKNVAGELGVEPDDQFAMGLDVEQEHGPEGPAGPKADITKGNPKATGQIAAAHVTEDPKYYSKLKKMEEE